jgi:hypothetical protein
MKINVKLFVWSFAVVPFVAATVAVLCSLEQSKPGKKSELGALTYGELVSIVGGAEGEGCANISRECTGDSVIVCDGCQTHIDLGGIFNEPPSTDTVIFKEYAGTDFNSPSSSPGSNKKSQLVQVESKECYKEWSCENIEYKEDSACELSGEGCADAYYPSSICTNWKLSEGDWVTFKKGSCVDP